MESKRSVRRATEVNEQKGRGCGWRLVNEIPRHIHRETLASETQTATHVLHMCEDDVRVFAIRLPPYVYGRGGSYFVPWLMQMAAKAGESLYVDDGSLRTSDVHVDDAAALYLLIAKAAKRGEVFNGTGSTTVTLRQLAEAIGAALQLPVRSADKKPMRNGGNSSRRLSDSKTGLPIARRFSN